MLKLNHKQLDVWKASVELVKEIYHITELFPADERFGITSQMRRASVSIVSNISEGLSKNTKLDTRRFLQIARSSLVEIDSQIEISLQLNFCNQDQIKILEELSNRVFAMLTNMIKKYSA
ncbi:MAG: four helix bundle protein [Ignavibacteriales bacterium]|nr:four helix bundle protein [Ignavibacteriales bacterium]